MAWYDPTSWELVSWGTSPHLADVDAAHVEWLDRIARFSQSSAYRPWTQSITAWATTQAGDARALSTTAEEYWQQVGAAWNANAEDVYRNLDVEQASKVLGLLGQSSAAARQIEAAKEQGQLGTIAAGTLEGTVADLDKKTKWYVVPLAALLLWGWVRK